MNRQQKIRLAAVLLAAVLLGAAAGLNLPASVRSGEVVAALSAWTDEVSENLFAVSAAPRETDGPAATPAPPEEAGFVIRLLGAETETPRKRVLIYHTHTYEAYEQTQDDPYEETEKWRTADSAHNVVRVGEELAALLRSLGSAYTRSLEMLEKRQAAGERYDLYIDLHRDAYAESQTGPNTVNAGGVEAAKLMLLIGKGEGQTSEGFDQRPDWEANLAIAQDVTDDLNAQVDGLCRDVCVKSGRFNQHVAVGCVLVEAGNNRNTLEEVLAAMPYLADAIVQVLAL